jgi:hypothetical protein
VKSKGGRGEQLNRKAGKRHALGRAIEGKDGGPSSRHSPFESEVK